ncbi:hypothetical protein IR073_06640 [Gemella sp. 19428wG2_WT2a]|nr:hypothetical protein [Gemella sp. 19428wG2_WT2a]TFU57712.1 hypothetical protein E4T67_06565 [Gemella sp. WT2a]
MKLKPEIREMLERITEHKFPTAKEPQTRYLNEKIAPIANEIITIFENEKLSYLECYKILEFTYHTLEYKSEQVNL